MQIMFNAVLNFFKHISQIFNIFSKIFMQPNMAGTFSIWFEFAIYGMFVYKYIN